MKNIQQTDNPQTLKPSTSSDSRHFPKTILLGVAAFLIIIIASGIGYYLGTNNQVNPTQNTNQATQASPTRTSSPTIPATANQKITLHADIKNEITTTQLKSISLLSIEGWKTIAFKGISFKIPSDLTFKDLEDSSNIGIIYKEGEVGGPRANISVQDYKGGSRRQEYFGNSYYDCHYIYEEALFGNIKALQIAIDITWCQGGGGDIVAVVGDKLVSVGRTVQYDLETKEILRFPLRDTIVSTIATN